jgi:trimethylamine--corrinoid protein Co-methyltransferase
MSITCPPLEPIHTKHRMQYLSPEQLDQMQDATLQILEETGVYFPSEKALAIFSDHDAVVDHKTQIVRLPRDLVRKTMSTAPRYTHLGARDPECDLHLEDQNTYFTVDGCGVEVIDFETRQRRPSAKIDVARQAHVADYLSAIGFYWPTVSAQDCGITSPLHELDACWNNTVKHVMSETVMGERQAQYAIEMATVIAGSEEELRRRPPLSSLICTVAPLCQDPPGLEAAMVFAKAGIPVTFMAMPTLGTTAPATLAGALVMADAELVSATVLMQLIHPGCAVLHSMLQAYADPRSGAYLGYPLDARGRYAPIDMAHRWGVSTLGGAYGTESQTPGTWQSVAEVALDPLLVGLSGSELVTGMGLVATYMVLYPESIILDADLYHRARYALMEVEVNAETLALDVINAVGPRGHFLAQKHTRKHMRNAVKMPLTYEKKPDGGYRDPVEVAREKADWILKNYQPAPLEEGKQKELSRILRAADKEIRGS